MCTAMTFCTDDDIHFLARTMDFSFELDANPIFIPRHHKFNSLVPETSFTTKYSFIGAGKDISGFIFADGFNEKGLPLRHYILRKMPHIASTPYRND